MLKILIIDSGIGGLAFTKSLSEKYPFFNYVLFCDKAYFPYGNKSKEELLLRTKLIINLISPDLVILACNTLSILVSNELRKEFKVPIYGVVEQTINHVILNKYKKVLLLGTKNTVNSNYYQSILNNNNIICDSYITDKEIYDIQNNKDISINIDKNKYDCIICGCTHFIKQKKAFVGFLNPIFQDEIFSFNKGEISLLTSHYNR